MSAYFRFELRRLAREPRLFIFTVVMPVVSYVVFTGVGDVRGTTEGVTVAAALMVGMAGYSAMACGRSGWSRSRASWRR